MGDILNGTSNSEKLIKMAVIMTADLAEKLIAHYEDCIGKVKECTDLKTARKLCINYHTNWGLCRCSYVKFGIYIGQCDWVTSHKIKSSFLSDWFATPVYDAKTTDEIIQLLQIRVDILKTFKQQ